MIGSSETEDCAKSSAVVPAGKPASVETAPEVDPFGLAAHPNMVPSAAVPPIKAPPFKKSRRFRFIHPLFLLSAFANVGSDRAIIDSVVRVLHPINDGIL